MNWTRRLRLQHLHLLVSLAETGSISEAARVSFTTQPALSKWLRELEESIGAPLFERHARGLHLTAHGSLLLAHARRALSEMQRARHALDTLRDGNSFRVAIGTSPAPAPNLVPAAIMEFLRLHPSAQVTLEETPMDMLLERLELRQLDLVVGRLDNYAPRQPLRSERLYNDQLRIVCRAGHPLTRRMHLTWEELYAFDWIVWPGGTPVRSTFDIALTAAGRPPLPCRIESSSLVGNLWLLQYSDLLSVTSARVAEHFAHRGLLVSLNFALGTNTPVGMCWRDEPFADAGLPQMMECLRTIAAAEPGRLDSYLNPKEP
ncbi:LysR substrate-binding domain-containing protein [Pseudomonas sp. 18175]|uniref:LysR substrate-binding domain-containing protein n=1 Tax=Pseudomonas sp. 18175 TaxID=3390056 RepID=UPI003D1FD72B